MRGVLESLPVHCPMILDELGKGPRTLLHGDLRLDNIYEVRGWGGWFLAFLIFYFIL